MPERSARLLEWTPRSWPPIRDSTGFLLHSSPGRPLLSDTSFGRDGANGGLAFADADARVGFACLDNQMPAMVDERVNRLTAALRDALDRFQDRQAVFLRRPPSRCGPASPNPRSAKTWSQLGCHFL